MSFVIAVQPFLSVALSDDANGAVTAFDIAPTARTRRLMADYGILFRARLDGLSLYYQTNPAISQPLVSPIDARVRFSFSIRIGETGAAARYMGLSGAGGAQFLLDNLDPSGAVLQGGSLTVGAVLGDADHLNTSGRTISVAVDLTNGIPANVEARDRFTDALIAEAAVLDPAAVPPVSPPAGATEISKTIDIPKGRDAALRVRTPAPGTLDRLFYADDDIAASRAVGVIDLYWEGPQTAVPATVGLNYTAVLARQ